MEIELNRNMWQVYILLCQDGSLYTGSTNNLEKRWLAHQSGKGSKYTRSHPPVKIVFTQVMQDKSQALKREIEIKSWTRTKKIVELKLIT